METSSLRNRAVSGHTADREYCLDPSSTQPFLTLDKSIRFFSMLYFKKNDLSVCPCVGELYTHECWCLLSPEAMDPLMTELQVAVGARNQTPAFYKSHTHS